MRSRRSVWRSGTREAGMCRLPFYRTTSCVTSCLHVMQQAGRLRTRQSGLEESAQALRPSVRRAHQPLRSKKAPEATQSASPRTPAQPSLHLRRVLTRSRAHGTEYDLSPSSSSILIHSLSSSYISSWNTDYSEQISKPTADSTPSTHT